MSFISCINKGFTPIKHKHLVVIIILLGRSIVNVPGKLYYNTELKNIKVGDGNNWKILGEDSETSGIKKYKQNIGDGTNNYFLINHNLSTEDISISIFEGKELVICDVEIRDLNNIIVRTADIPEENSLKVVVIG